MAYVSMHIYSDILSDTCSGPATLHSIRSYRGRREGEEEGEEGEEEEGVAPLLKSRDPQLAGGGKLN